ncbi:hypothetical protein V8D89_012144 [Ganoderma adspersum]
MIAEVQLVLENHGDGHRATSTNATQHLRMLATKDRKPPSLTAGQDMLFVSIWSQGIPVVVEHSSQKMQCSWSPEQFVTSHGHVHVEMIKMRIPHTITESVTIARFFELFQINDDDRGFAIKVKDWPPSSLFETDFKRHFNAFIEVVRFPSYTRYNGYCNIAAHWPDSVSGLPSLKPNLGPKMYVATRDLNEQGSTPLHLDATAAVNILVYSASKGAGAAGALWHIFAADDSDKIRTYLREKGLYSADEDPIHECKTYVTAAMRTELQELGVCPYEIHQKVGDAVLIPAGCAHQVSNLLPCIKVACDFLSPHDIAWSRQMTGPPKERTRNEQRRKRSRETPCAHEDYVRRKKQRTRQSSATHSMPREYQCPLATCPRPEKLFDLQGVFSHL